MVKVVDYKMRESSKGNAFFVLVVQGGMEAVRSRETGQVYFKLSTATVQTTFDEETCQEIVGEDLQGRIEKVECEPFGFMMKENYEALIIDG